MTKQISHEIDSPSQYGSRFWRRLQLRLRSLQNRWSRRLKFDIDAQLTAFIREAKDRESARQHELLEAVDQKLCKTSATMLQRVEESVDRIVKDEQMKRLIDGLIEMADGLWMEIRPCDPIDDFPCGPELAGAIDLLKLAYAQVLDLLATLEIVPVDHGEGRFDPAFQRPVSRVATQDPKLDQHVCLIVRPGFKRHQRLWRPELITLYIFSEEQKT